MMHPIPTGSVQAVLGACSDWIAGTVPNAYLSQRLKRPSLSTTATAEGPHFRWSGSGELQWAAAKVDVSPGMRWTSERLYRALFGSLGERSLYRIWNFVPRINEDEDGLENYQQFSYGRSVAFEDTYRIGFETRLPAASAVGTPGKELVVVAVAGKARPRFWENPAQVPAYRYPARFGPRSPSFSRATAADLDGHRWLFVSGTAAIRGSESRFPNDPVGQTKLTLENLDLITRRAGVDLRVPPADAFRFFRVYLRHPADYPLVRELLETHLLSAADSVEYLHAEVCRADLDVEIEATISHPLNP